jgi:hypothetical protein
MTAQNKCAGLRAGHEINGKEKELLKPRNFFEAEGLARWKPEQKPR